MLNVERKANAEAQYIYAAMVDTEEAWKSVSVNFPKDQTWGLRAKQQLARLYLQEDDFQRAMPIFNDFAGMPEVEKDFRAFGLAGQAVVLAMEGKNRRSASALADLWPIRDSLDPQMRGLMAYVIRRNRKALSGPITDQWSRFLQPTLPRVRE
jgi:hypothetical protein